MKATIKSAVKRWIWRKLVPWKYKAMITQEMLDNERVKREQADKGGKIEVRWTTI